jgi:hypothetical protein
VTRTLEEIKQDMLGELDVNDILEILQIEPAVLLDRFEDYLELRRNYIETNLYEEDEEDSGDTEVEDDV